MNTEADAAMLRLESDLARRVLDAAPDAMVIIDASGTVRFANRQVSALFGYPHDSLIGQSVEMLMPERFRRPHVGHRQEYLDSLRVRPMGIGLELFGRRHDGSEFPLEISLSPVADEEHLLVAAAIRDVTDRKAVEADLIEARGVAELAREAADRANQGKSRFLATASHDLRQPLQTLALLNGSLRRMVSGADASEALLQQEQAIAAMSRLLNALLDISKLESGAIRPEPTDFTVATLFEELRREFAALAISKGLELHVESCADCVHSDPSLVQQILRNLVSNAIKYTPAGWVQLRCLHEVALVRIEVLDTGIGIPADQLPYIYDEFYQVNGGNRSREGYGLGLSIVQRLVKLLALELNVSSEPGRGSTFSLVLPASAASVGSVGIPGGRTAGGKSPITSARVLLVEDDPAVRAATRMLLAVAGYQVTAVAAMNEALRAARESLAVDLVIADYHLGDGETGIEVIAALRKALGVPVRAVLMTGDTSSSIKELPLDGQLRVANKPINAEELLHLLATCMASSPISSARTDAP
jgi:two-component system, sensor histidine kinase